MMYLFDDDTEGTTVTGRYEPLTRYLETRREPLAPLTFREVERVLNRSLPRSARVHQPWWANTTTHSHADAWLRVGWKTRQVDLAGERVVFVRDAAAKRPHGSVEEPGRSFRRDHLVVDLDKLSEVAAKLLSEYANEAQGDVSIAVSRALEEAALARRNRLIDLIRANAPRVPDNSVDLIREDRDAR